MTTPLTRIRHAHERIASAREQRDSLILEALAAGTVTRADIARALGVTPGAITHLITRAQRKETN